MIMPATLMCGTTEVAGEAKVKIMTMERRKTTQGLTMRMRRERMAINTIEMQEEIQRRSL